MEAKEYGGRFEPCPHYEPSPDSCRAPLVPGTPARLRDTAAHHRSEISEQAPGRRLFCAACGRFVTAEGWRISVRGRHEHAFLNPHGHLFEIGCFSHSPGVSAEGSPTMEFTWFPGHAWSLALCASCSVHLGWRYDGSDGFFFGLILPRLIPETPDGGSGR